MRKKKKEFKPPSKAVINAWNTLAEYLHENEIYVIMMDIEYDEELTKVTKGKKPFTYEEYECYRRFILKDLDNLKIVSKNLRFD